MPLHWLYVWNRELAGVSENQEQEKGNKENTELLPNTE
jgi:hypothetical protein